MKRWLFLCCFLLAACSAPVHDGKPQINYHGGVKYVLHGQYQHQTALRCEPYDNDFLTLTVSGLLVIHPGYGWDGASGPAWDTRSVMRSALVHDACYELIRRGACDHSQKGTCDDLFATIYTEDARRGPYVLFRWFGDHLRRFYLFWAVDKFGESSVQPKAERPVLVAP